MERNAQRHIKVTSKNWSGEGRLLLHFAWAKNWHLNTLQGLQIIASGNKSMLFIYLYIFNNLIIESSRGVWEVPTLRDTPQKQNRQMLTDSLPTTNSGHVSHYCCLSGAAAVRMWRFYGIVKHVRKDVVVDGLIAKAFLSDMGDRKQRYKEINTFFKLWLWSIYVSICPLMCAFPFVTLLSCFYFITFSSLALSCQHLFSLSCQLSFLSISPPFHLSSSYYSLSFISSCSAVSFSSLSFIVSLSF